ncbi:MAG: hypothetical protein ACFFDH_04400 [Promethearchaeota archaeon]
MKKVKGSMVIMVVKSIKVNPSKRGRYNQMLSNKAIELLNQRILTASWYPYETYRECLDALCLIEGGNNPTTLFEWGIDEAKRWLSTLYQSTVFRGDIQLAVEKYTRLHRKLYNFGEIVANFISDTEVEFTYEDFPRDWANFFHMAIGWAKTYVELCFDKEVKYSFSNKSWVNRGWTKVRVSWTP